MATLQKSKEKRDAVLLAVLNLVNSGGIQEASMAKVAKMAQISPATIYLYFENKQDLINQLYLSIKASFTEMAFSNLSQDIGIKQSFKHIWFNMLNYKLTQNKEASFLSQCDNSPLIDEDTRQEGLKFLLPLFDLWQRGQNEGLIKKMSPYLLYAFSIYPMSFLMNMQSKGLYKVDKKALNEAYLAAWDSIKV